MTELNVTEKQLILDAIDDASVELAKSDKVSKRVFDNLARAQSLIERNLYGSGNSHQLSFNFDSGEHDD